jgi:hypothetical protein
VKKILILLLVVAALFVVLNRQRLYLRDPLASLTLDGVEQPGVQIYINYSNDVLLENDHPPMYLTLVQQGGRLGTPVGLKCLHYIVCRTDAAESTLVLESGKAAVESMSSKAVTFQTHDGHTSVVTLH